MDNMLLFLLKNGEFLDLFFFYKFVKSWYLHSCT